MAYGTFQAVVNAQDNAQDNTTDTIWQDVFASRININAWEQDALDYEHFHSNKWNAGIKHIFDVAHSIGLIVNL